MKRGSVLAAVVSLASMLILLVLWLSPGTSAGGRLGHRAGHGGASAGLPVPVAETDAPPAKGGAGAAAVDSVVLARFDFDDAEGNPDPQGWAAHDVSAVPNDQEFWHVEDFAGLANYAPLAGQRSLWCGARTAPDGATDGTWPGYGNDWHQAFQSVPFAVTGRCTVSFLASYDVEPGYDYAYLEFGAPGAPWTILTTLNGQTPLAPPVTVRAEIGTEAHAGTLVLRIRFRSDPGFSDEDGHWNTSGAILVDDLEIRDAGGLVDRQTFEAEPVGATGTADGDWSTVALRVPFGLHGALFSGAGVLQEDPAVTNPTGLWGFFADSPDDYGCAGHPEQLALPHGRYPESGDPPYDIESYHLRNQIQSPWIRLDRDEAGGYLAQIPDTLRLEFQVYRDLPLNRGVFYTYSCRFRGPTSSSRWIPSGWIYFSPSGKDWFTLRKVQPVASSAQEVQLALEARDYGYHPSYLATDTCHSHSPIFDNVRVTAAGTLATGFQDIGAWVGAAAYGDVDWGDYDNDGDLDVLVVGASDTYKRAAVYRNDAGSFVDAGASLTGVTHASAQWGDYDNDGDLDILLAGHSDLPEVSVTRLYRNDAGGFTYVPTSLPGLLGDFADRGLGWGDFDNDGDLDLLLAGRGFPGQPAQYHCGVWRNDGGGAFTDVGAGLPRIAGAAVAWGDYDNDGDLDILLAGSTPTTPLTRIYRNDGVAGFADAAAGLPAVSGGVAWGDYDADGDLDIALTGGLSRIYRNDGGAFVDIAAGLPSLSGSTVDWGDADADGDLDLLLTGYDGIARVSRVYRNDAGAFVDAGAGLPGAIYGSGAWGDYDGDGLLDILLAGWNPTDGFFTKIFMNRSLPFNTPPGAPADLTGSIANGILTLQWDAATDAQTPAAGLSYNLRIGSTPDGCEIVSPMADAAGGGRWVCQLGNVQQRRSWSVRLALPIDRLYCGVQAIDGGFAGSPFAELEIQLTGAQPPPGPAAYALHAAVPNPFNPLAKLAFELPVEEHVRLRLFDARGRLIRTLLDQPRPAGRHEAAWDGTDATGRRCAAGVYVCLMEAGTWRQAVRLTLLK